MKMILGTRFALTRESPLLVLLLLAAALRAGVLWKLGDNLALDRDNYRCIAAGVASGAGYVDPDARTATAYRPPLYPLLVAAVLWSGGDDWSIGIVQLLLGVATVGVTVGCGRRLGLNRASLAAGLLVAVDPLLLFQTALVMTETLATLLAALLVWFCLGRQAPGRDFALGIAFGLCCLCRPTFWAFGAVAVIVRIGLGLRACLSDRCRREICWKPALCAAAGTALAIAPWAIRNTLLMGRAILTTTHGGYTLLLAHNPAYTRAVVEQPRGSVWEGDAVTEWKTSLESEMARTTPPIDITHLSPEVEIARDHWMTQKAWNYIRNEPLYALQSGLTLLGRFWSIVPMTTKGAPLPAAIRTGLGTFYSAVFLAMLVGLVRVVRFDWRTWWPLLALVAGFTLVHSLYWADMRMRTPLMPAIALLAAAAGGRGEAVPSRD